MARFILKYDAQFKRDYKHVMHKHPALRREFAIAASELAEHGALPESYQPHVLGNAGGIYNSHIDFHLSNGSVDVVVLYMPHKTNPVIRFVRMGTHDELFRGPQR